MIRLNYLWTHIPIRQHFVCWRPIYRNPLQLSLDVLLLNVLVEVKHSVFRNVSLGITWRQQAQHLTTYKLKLYRLEWELQALMTIDLLTTTSNKNCDWGRLKWIQNRLTGMHCYSSVWTRTFSWQKGSCYLLKHRCTFIVIGLVTFTAQPTTSGLSSSNTLWHT